MFQKVHSGFHGERGLLRDSQEATAIVWARDVGSLDWCYRGGGGEKWSDLEYIQYMKME